jgi:hypothetical protein
VITIIDFQVTVNQDIYTTVIKLKTAFCQGKIMGAWESLAPQLITKIDNKLVETIITHNNPE